MGNLIKEIKEVKNSSVRKIIEKRLKEFSSFKRKNGAEWFSELCFCLLTANSKAKTAIEIQKDLGAKGFCDYTSAKIKSTIRKHKHRFHNNKTNFIVGARKCLDIKIVIKQIVDSQGELEARDWLVKNIKGLGYKESSHFLRNVGYTSLAILDRHILNLMVENKYLKEKPKSLNKKNYLEIEQKFKKIATKLGMSLAELDLYMWYLKTGKILK